MNAVTSMAVRLFSLPLKGGGSGRGLREASTTPPTARGTSQRTPTPTLPLKKGEGARLAAA
jgi:hypothetical protein